MTYLNLCYVLTFILRHDYLQMKDSKFKLLTPTDITMATKGLIFCRSFYENKISSDVQRSPMMRGSRILEQNTITGERGTMRLSY